jgi:hypothetical protein
MHAQSKKMPAAAGHRSLFAHENVAGTASYSGAIFKRVAFPVDYVACAVTAQPPARTHQWVVTVLSLNQVRKMVPRPRGSVAFERRESVYG